VATDAGLIPLLHSPAAFKRALVSLAKSEYAFNVSRLQACGIPANATQRLLAGISVLLS